MEEGEIPEENRVSHRKKEGERGACTSGKQPAVPATLIYNPLCRPSSINPLKLHVKFSLNMHMHNFLGGESLAIIVSQRAQGPGKI